MCSSAVAYPTYLRERARALRLTKHLSLSEIAERLDGHRSNLAMQGKYRRLREEAYAQGWEEYDELVGLPTLRDFVALYIAEGYKRCRNRVSIANSDERVLALASSWLRVLTTEPLSDSVQYHRLRHMLRARVQAWIDRIRQDWALDSAARHGA